jgi:hypothetical protein
VDVIERAARALSLALYREERGDRDAPEPPSSGLDENLVMSYIDQGSTDLGFCVRAVLTAIREPSPEIINAYIERCDLGGDLVGDINTTCHPIYAAWTAMIDAALSEQQQDEV